MENVKTNIESLIIEDLKLLSSFNEYYQKNCDEGSCYTPSKLRTMIEKAEVPCISSKTYDSGIKLLNNELDYLNNWKYHNSNPVYESIDRSEKEKKPLHTQIFFQRLPHCLLLFGQELYKYKKEDEVSKQQTETFNRAFGLHKFQDNNSSYNSPHDYILRIQQFKMPPFFAPIFIGIVGALKKEKTNWKTFRNHALGLAEDFYNEGDKSINIFLSKDKDTRESLYAYWLELFYPDELFALFENISEMTIHASDPIISYNLYILSSSLSGILFLTRTGIKMFCQDFGNTLLEYRRTPMIDPDTGKSRNIDLYKELMKKSYQIQNYEANILQIISHE